MSSRIKAAIMQPYFLPYIGYWQLINSVDKFVIYDDIEFTKKGWINRNRILQNCKAKTFSIPLKKDSDYLNINKRFLSGNAEKELKKTQRIIKESYRKAPFADEGIYLFDKCLNNLNEVNLFDFIHKSILETTEVLEIKTPIYKSSDFDIDPSLKAEKRVIETCKRLSADAYLNPIGGVDLYNRDDFKNEGLELSFQKVKDYKYEQGCNEFIPHLSIIDVIMFNGFEGTKELLSHMDEI